MTDYRTGAKTLFVCLLVLLPCACYRQGSINTSITFQGVVNSGHIGQDSSGNTAVIVDGPQQNATVVCEGYPETAKTAADGRYSLTIRTTRRFNSPYADTYSLTASNTLGNSEKATISGNPGDIIQVRGFILYRHPEE